MRKRKENIPLHQPGQELPLTEALETEREQRYEEVGGETATEGVGMGFDSDSELARHATTADGQLVGDSLDPPVSAQEVPLPRTGRTKGERKKKKIARDQGNHLAARSTKKI